MPNWSDTPMPGTTSWTNRFDGQSWRCNRNGIFIRENGGASRGPMRTGGNPTTCDMIVGLFKDPIVGNSIRFGVAPELIVMVIATESAMFRKTKFTGQPTFRWEPHVPVKDDPPEFRGDYSVGPMQTLATTARWVIHAQNLGYDPLEVFPAIRVQPNIPPEDHPGYGAALNIEIGAAEIAQRLPKTGDNPILISAAYNAGGIYDSSNPRSKTHNRWHIRSYGNHLDRAARWYGDACAVIGALR